MTWQPPTGGCVCGGVRFRQENAPELVRTQIAR